MPHVSQGILAVLLVSLAAGCKDLPTQAERPPSAPRTVPGAILSSPVGICVTSSIPAGYVVTGGSYSARCPSNNGAPNVLTIQTPASPITICVLWSISNGSVVQNVPIGYVVTSASYTAGCGSNNGRPNAITIRTPASPITICVLWSIPNGSVVQSVPSGYVVTSASYSAGCASNNGNPNALTLRTPASPITICVLWPVPNGSVAQNVPGGYVVTGASYSAACGSNNGRPNALTIQTPASPITICVLWSISNGSVVQSVPSGYVVTSTSYSAGCASNNGNPNALTLRTPASPITICVLWPVPNGSVAQNVPGGYVVTGASYSAACGSNNGKPNALTIQTPASPITICILWLVPNGSVVQNVPGGYVVTSTSYSAGCASNNGNPNALTLRTPASPITICVLWPVPNGSVVQNVPSGYVVTSASYSAACASNNGKPNALTLRTPASPITICILWSIPNGSVVQNVPSGYVVTSASYSAGCASNNGNSNTLTIRTPTSPMIICVLWATPNGYVRQVVPDGYVVTGGSYSPTCPSNNGAANVLTIQRV